MKERLAAADMYADIFNVSLENAYLNLDKFHQQYMGQNFVKKTGWKAVADSFQLNFVNAKYNELSQKWAESKGEDLDLLKAIEDHERKIEQLRDHAPKVWQDDYISMGGWHDVGQFLRSVGTSTAENAGQIATGIGVAALAATGVGAIAGAAGLSAGTAGLLAAGASRTAIAGSTYHSTWGIKYREMRNAGIPHDIALSHAKSDAAIEGMIEGMLGGVEAAGAGVITKAIVPQAVGKATTRWFVSGKMGAAAKACLGVLKEGGEEFTEEFLQAFSSASEFNIAADKANKQLREEKLEKLREIYGPLFEDIRGELEKELEKHPEVSKKEWGDVLEEGLEGGISAFFTAIILGVPVEITGYNNNVRAAQQLAEMAQAAPNKAVLKEWVEKAKEHGFQMPVEGLKTDEEAALLDHTFDVQQERMTPEQREAKQKEAEDAAALAEVTDYSDEEIEYTDDETGETKLNSPETKEIYKENDKFYTEEYTDTNEDGSIRRRIYVGDPGIDDSDRTGTNQYGYIKVTETGDTITIDEFKMKKRYENLRNDFYEQVSERFEDKNVIWNPKEDQNIALRDQLVNNNRRGPKYGLNYHEKGSQPSVSNEARLVAQRFQPYLKKSTPLETALAAELFNNFYRRRGESLNGAMHRLIGSVTNEAPPDVIAAQRQGKLVKGAIWFDETAEGMKRIVYLNKNAADISTVIHETSHAVAHDFTEAERRIAARALNGYQLKNGTTVYFGEDGGPWTDEQHEAFAEALENYFTNGTAPNEEIKGLFERIKEFMKRVYQTMKGWTELSPQVEEFYQKLFSGELVDQARTETGNQTHEQAHSEAEKGKTINDTTGAENATTAPQNAAKAVSPTATQSHIEPHTENDVISSPDIPFEEKAEAVLDEAGDALFQAGEAAQEQLDAVYNQYHNEDGTAKEGWLKAPNGKDTNLTENQWLAVRTAYFKNWFGDWEALAKSENYQNGMSYTEAQTKLSALLDNGKPVSLQNAKTGEEARLSKSSIGKLISNEAVRKSIENGFSREQHYAVASDINHLFYNAKKLFERPDKNNDANVKIHRYAAPLHFGENIAVITVKESVQHGKRIYTAELMEIKKLEGMLEEAKNAHFPASSSSDLNIADFLKSVKPNSVSKIVDENGEPLAIYHGTDKQFDIFKTANEWGYGGAYFSTNRGVADIYARGGTIYDIFANLRNPFIVDAENRFWDSIPRPKEMPGNGQVDTQEIAKFARDNGYDGVMVMNIREHGGIGTDVITFEPNQIKSATNNAGTFDPDNPSILFQTAWSGSPHIFDSFDDQKIGTGIGTIKGHGHYVAGLRFEAENYKKGPTGRLYEVNIPDDHEYLHWDEPLANQPEAVTKAIGTLLSWKPDGTSNFLPEYNIRRMGDGYSFGRPVGGKLKYNTMSEAQDAAKAEIMGYTGSKLYNTLADTFTPKKASMLLEHLGLKGNKYKSLSVSPETGKRAHNYAIYSGKHIQIKNVLFQTAEANEQFNGELDQFLEGKLKKGHIFKLGEPGGILQRTGFPAGQEIELASGHLLKKANDKNHPFNPADLKNLVQAINEPVAVFAYGDPTKAQNVIIEIQQNDKNYLVGIHFDQQRQGVFVSSIRGLFPKDNHEWLNWINQDKLLYADIEKLQAVVAQQRSNTAEVSQPQLGAESSGGGNPTAEQFADVSRPNLEPIKKIIQNNAGVKDFFPNEGDAIDDNKLLFQTEGRDLMEEAASWDSWEEWRDFTKAYGDTLQEIDPWWSEEQIDAWYKSFWENSKKAKEAEDKAQGVPEGETTPAEQDREFKELISDGKSLEEFAKEAVRMYNEDYSQWGAVDEEDAAERDRQAETSNELRRILAHTTWQTIIKAGGEIATNQRKGLLTMIRNAPREYRAIYAQVMGREDLAVSPEDMTAEILKNKITDTRRDKIDSMTPEQLRKLEEDIGIEEVARKLRTGKLKLDDPDVMAYIKRLNDEVKQKEQELKEAEADREEDNKYIENKAGKIFSESWDKVLKAKEEISRSTEELDRAIKDGEKAAATIAWRKQRQAKSSYNSIMEVLETLNEQHHLELDIQAAIANEQIKDYAKSAKTQATLQKHIAVKAATEKLKAHLAELKEKQKRAKELTQAMKKAKEEIFEPANPRSVNAEQGVAIATIQRFIKPSMLKGLDRFMDGVNKPILQEIFNRWKTDEKLRSESLEGKPSITQEKMTRLFNKEKFDDLTNEEIKYLSEKLPPKDWAAEFGMQDITDIRNGSERIEAAKQNLQKNLPQDVYYRIMDKPLSEWTLNEVQELAGIIGNLEALGRNIYKANIEAEQRRIREYQDAVKKTIRTVIKKGMVINDSDELEKIIGKYKGEDGGTAEGEAARRKHSLLNRYSNINVYRFARILDNGDVNGKNMAALYRMEGDAFNQKMRTIDARQDRIYKVMADEKIKEGELWEIGAKIDLGGDMGVRKFTKAELMGFAFASRNEYSREALLGGNLLTQREQEAYQVKGADATALEELSAGRYAKLEQAARKFIADNPQYQKLMDAIAQDLTVSGQRLAEYLAGYNNTIMPTVEFYFPMFRTAAVSADTADAKLAKELMGSSAGAFKLYVEKGFTEARHKIPIQYQTAIKLDMLAVWSEAVSQQEHFMAYGQAVKDLNKIYKQSRSVRDAIHSRYGREAVSYIDKYINEMANPNPEKTRSDLDKWVRLMRGNTAAAYLGWKTSSIVKQFLTSPAPFFGYMNMAEYWGTFIEYTAHREDMWNQICELSPHMKHRSRDMMQELVKEQAKQRFDNKAFAAMSKFNKTGMAGLEWIDQMCVAPGWMVLYRNETKRLTGESANANMSEKDISVKAAQYADDIIRLTQPDSRLADLPPLFKGNSELGKAFLQFTQSLSNIYQQIRYDIPQNVRDKMFRRAAGTIIGYTIAGIMLGAITQGFDDDDDEEARARKIAWWATTQFTDSIPILGSEVTRLVEVGFTGKAQYQGSQTLIPGAAKLFRAAEMGFKAAQEKDFDKSFKTVATAFEGGGLFVGFPVSGAKEMGALFGIGDGDGELDLNPGALVGKRR